jgi:hypothetical protein
MHTALRKHFAACITFASLFFVVFLFFDTSQDTGEKRGTRMMRRSTQAILAASIIASPAFGTQVLHLSTVKWTLTSPNFSNITVPGKVPSQVHLDLHAAQVRVSLYRS